MSRTKDCIRCGSAFSKRDRDEEVRWQRRRYCSRPCANKATASPESPEVRFWRYVNKAEQGCWEWIGTKDGGGYGQLSAGRGRAPFKAHRLSFELANGPIPVGLFILHKCDNPACVNPLHLELGDQKKNMADMYLRGRQCKNKRLGPQQRPMLSREQANFIRQQKLAGESYISIGAAMGINPSTARLYAINKRTPE